MPAHGARDDRVILRPFVQTDRGLLEAAQQDPSVVEISDFMSASVESLDQALARRMTSVSKAAVYLVVEECHTGRPIGQIILWTHEIDSGRVTLNYWILRDARGNGYAELALAAAAARALDQPNVHRVGLFVEPTNLASLRTAEKAGFEREGVLRRWQLFPDGTARDAVVLGLTRPLRRDS